MMQEHEEFEAGNGSGRRVADAVLECDGAAGGGGIQGPAALAISQIPAAVMILSVYVVLRGGNSGRIPASSSATPMWWP